MTRPAGSLRAPHRAVLACALAATLVACGDVTLPFVPTPQPTPEQPRPVVVEVVSGAGGEPLPGAEVMRGAERAVTDAQGQATIMALTGDVARVTATGHDIAEGTVPHQGDLRIQARPNVMSGTVMDASGAPLAGVRVFVEGTDQLSVTDSDGRYELSGVPVEGIVVAKRAGYRLTEVPIAEPMAKDIELQPFEARAVYAHASVFETPGRLEAMLDMIERTDLNAIVIDVKETDGRLMFDTDLAVAEAIGAERAAPLFDPGELLPMLRERGIYTIARMVVMKDNTLAAARPELAVRNVATGGAWTDNLGGSWLDPSAPGVAEYAAAIAAEVADAGFDEVQLDYIRWYSDGPYQLADTNVPNTQPFRLPAMRRILRTIDAEFETRRAFLAADVFPISFIFADDQGIGQRPEVFMPYVDYVCPMVYPSHYGPGMFGFPVPNDRPYEVVAETLKVMNAHADGHAVAVRPWIQDFGYGAFPPYSAEQVRAEIQAATDLGANGWMIWHPRGIFTEAALGAPRDGEDAGPVAWTEPTGGAAPSPSGGPAPSAPAASP